MNISHMEVEITVRTVDRRNAPIASATEFVTGTPTEIANFVAATRLKRLGADVNRIVVESLEKRDPYVE